MNSKQINMKDSDAARNRYAGARRSIDGVFYGTRQPNRPRARFDNYPKQHHQNDVRRPRYIQPAPPISREEMVLPGGNSRVAKREIPRPRHSFRKWSLRSATVLVVIVLVIGGYLFSKGYLQLHRVFSGGATAAALNEGVDPSQLKGEGSGRVNILLLGIGGHGHDGADLTDTIMIASIDPVNKKIDLLSVPRDMWVKEPNNFMSDYGKLNAAYESGKYSYLGRMSDSNDNKQAVEAGFQAADRTISSVIGIPINYNVLVNFHAFQQAVDAVGGINIDVPEQLYDPTMAWENNWNPVLAKKGEQTMNGREALLYVRSRETSSDFARGERQRLVLLALKSEILSAGTLSNPLKISDLLSALGDNVRTDISLGDMQKIYDLAGQIDSGAVRSVGLDDKTNKLVTTGTLNGQSIVEPSEGLFSYSNIQSYVRNELKDGYIAKENALVTVLNGTSTAGLATKQTDVLKSYGYRVAQPANAPVHDQQKTILVDLTQGKDKYTKHYLERRYGVTATTSLPASVQANGADFVIILGQDEAIHS